MSISFSSLRSLRTEVPDSVAPLDRLRDAISALTPRAPLESFVPLRKSRVLLPSSPFTYLGRAALDVDLLRTALVVLPLRSRLFYPMPAPTKDDDDDTCDTPDGFLKWRVIVPCDYTVDCDPSLKSKVGNSLGPSEGSSPWSSLG